MIGWVPTNRDDVVNAAVVPVMVIALLIADPLSANVTVPVAPLGTAAVNVTFWPYTDGFREDVTVTAATPPLPGVALLTVKLRGDETLARKVPFPGKLACRVETPTGSAVVLRVATPPVSVPEPNGFPLLVKFTVLPSVVRLPAEWGDSVAVKHHLLTIRTRRRRCR